MKKFMILFYALLIGTASFAADTVVVNKRVLQSFEAGFPDAAEISWYQLPGTYQASFIAKGIRTKASYRNDGTLLNFSRYYQEDHLPYYIQLNVKEQYPGKKIFGVTELSSNSNSGDNLDVEYYIKLGDDKEWLTVKVNNDGEMSVTEKFKKPASVTVK